MRSPAGVAGWRGVSVDVLPGDDSEPGLVLQESRFRNPLGDIRVVLAKPRVFIPAEVVFAVRQHRSHPGITLDGDVLTIEGENRKVIYRLTQDPVRHGYIAEWPD
jgi:hypothetical protein